MVKDQPSFIENYRQAKARLEQDPLYQQRRYQKLMTAILWAAFIIVLALSKDLISQTFDMSEKSVLRVGAVVTFLLANIFTLFLANKKFGNKK